VKALALLLAAVPIVGAAATSWFLLFLFTFPWENSEPTPGGTVVLIVGGALLTLLVPAVLCWIWIAVDRLRRAEVAFAVHALAAFALLAWALGESQDSDSVLLALALPIEACGFLAVVLARRRHERHRRGGRVSRYAG
jgi:hypothetical protein